MTGEDFISSLRWCCVYMAFAAGFALRVGSQEGFCFMGTMCTVVWNIARHHETLRRHHETLRQGRRT